MGTANKIVIFILTLLAANLATQSSALADTTSAGPSALIAPMAASAPAAAIAPAPASASAALSEPATLTEDTLPFKYTGNLSSRKFHRPRCPYSRMMCDYKRVRFHFRRQAVSEGYEPCRYCLPARWTTVTCAIRSQSLEKNTADKEGKEKNAADEMSGRRFNPNNPDKNCPLGTWQEQPNISSP